LMIKKIVLTLIFSVIHFLFAYLGFFSSFSLPVYIIMLCCKK
jgi:hypothetical protein